eukprot:9155803-Pyramimonas_sp.AAC.1
MGLTRAAFVFRVMCVSVLSFILQVHPVSPALLSYYREAVMLPAARPRSSFSYSSCAQLRKLHLPVEFQDLLCLAKATCIRIMIRNDGIGAVFEHIRSLEDRPEHVFARMRGGYWKSSFLHYMHSLHEWYYAIPSRVNVDLPRLQARLYELMSESFPAKEDPRQTLFRRVAAWFPEIPQRSMDRFWTNSYDVLLKTQ